MKRGTAFSLIELSIVILIIGILIAGITQSSRLVKQMRLNSARAQTQSSAAASVKDLALWLEATSEASFGGSEPEENAELVTWYDINPQSITKYNATQSAINKKPLYTTNSINNLPAITFDGSNDDMVLTGFNAGSNTSYFFVIKPATAQVEAIFDSTPNAAYVFRNLCDQPNYPTCTGDGAFSWWNGANPTPQTQLGLSANLPYVVYVETKLVPTKVMNYYRNGTFISTSTNADTTATAWSNPRIGSVNLTLKAYNGKIGEIIIFSRTLKDEERQAITQYLGKKWGIKVS